MIKSLFVCRGISRRFFGVRDRLVRSIMVGCNELIERVEKRAIEADEMVELLKEHIECLQKAVDKQQTPESQAQIESLKVENERLKGEAMKLKTELIFWEVRNGVKQVALPKSTATVQQPKAAAAAPTPAAQPDKKFAEQLVKTKAKKKTKVNKPAKQQEGKKDEQTRLDASRFDFRVGRINAIKKHPDADNLFVSEIDVGEECPRTICNGAVGHIPMEALQVHDALVVIMANLKPVKMRGIFSQGMLMSANAGEMHSVVIPPEGAVPGDRIVFDTFPGTPDAQLKKKVWEQCLPDFKTDAQCIPNYKGDPFHIPGKGICTTSGIKNGVVR